MFWGFSTYFCGELQQYLPFTVLKQASFKVLHDAVCTVATVLTVYGIETKGHCRNIYKGDRLQQYLPFTVLKRYIARSNPTFYFNKLQQYLPFTVLKPPPLGITKSGTNSAVATVLIVYGIETNC